jgi:protein TonB
MSPLLFRGFRVSLLIHLLIVSSIVYVGNLLPDVTPPLIIDFSIESDCANSLAPQCSEKVVQPEPDKTYQPPPARKIIPVSKPQQVLNKPEKIKPKPVTQEQLKPEPVKPVVKQILPMKRKKLSAIKEKVIVTVNKRPPEITSVQNPDTKKEVTHEKVIDSALDVSSDYAQNVPQNVSQKLVTAVVPAKSQVNLTSLKEHYVKANYSYIRDVVERKTNYPSIARKMGWEGKVLVAFTICDDGQVEDIRIIKSCGFKSLDKNAIKTIKQCAPFPKPPVRAEVTLPITYRLN